MLASWKKLETERFLQQSCVTYVNSGNQLLTILALAQPDQSANVR
ncbi:MAG: hypothetical protein ACREUR_10840 [Nitrosospira sp.]